MDLAAFIDRYDRAGNEQDVDAIMSMHTSDMVFETTPAQSESRERPSGSCSSQPSPISPTCASVVAAATSATTSWPANGRRPPRGGAIEWDGIDVFPFRDGLIARKDIYSGSRAPRLL